MSVTLINVFEVPAGDEDAFIAAWEKTRDYLMKTPARRTSRGLASTVSCTRAETAPHCGHAAAAG